ncbi:MAG: hypothetical protein ACK5GN_13295 [Pseudomonadota bacterium]|jgi:hypothetical protein
MMPQPVFTYWARLILWALHLILLGVSVYFIPVNWDEGWTFCSARHLLMDGNYGCRYNGNFTPTRLTTSLSTVLIAYSGFALWGVSYIGGRLLFAVQAIILIWLYTRLVRTMWGKKAELVCLSCFLMLSSDTAVHPMALGAQAWGEIPALTALILGVVIIRPLLSTSGRTTGLIRFLLCTMCLVAAATTKIQFRPFITTAFLAAGALVYITRRAYLPSLLFVSAGLVTWLATPWVPTISMPHVHPLDTTGMVNLGSNLTRTIGLVTDIETRLYVAGWLMSTHGAVVLTMLASLFLKDARGMSTWLSGSSSMLPLVTFSGIVLSWFLFLSIGFDRYAAPALICAAGPIALFISTLYEQSRPQVPPIVTHSWKIPRPHVPYFVCILLLIGGLNLVGLSQSINAFRSYNDDMQRTADFLNSTVRSDHAVETYDSPLFHLLNVRYIFPPDDYHMRVLQARAGRPATPPTLSARYVALGPWSRFFKIAGSDPEGYSEIARFGSFTIYEQRAAHEPSSLSSALH